MKGFRLLLAASVCTVFFGTAAASVLSECPGGDYACMMAQINALSEGAGLPGSDTLYRALDTAGLLRPHDLLRYGRVKSLLGNYRAAAHIYCRAATTGENRLEHAALTQMGSLLADADSAEQAAAVRIFERCALSGPGADTALFRNGLADICGRLGLFEQEVSLLTRHHSAGSPSGGRLSEVARKHFSARRYRLAATAAAAAYERMADEPQKRSGTAFVAYQAYMQIRARDSALVWLHLSGVSDKEAKIQAVALNQEAGHLEAAAALIDSLPVSLSKDTLAVRQLLFSGEPAAALGAIMASRSTAWTMAPRERLLWRGRCMLFGSQAYEAAAAFDSLRFMPNWHAASEVLRYRYWIQKLDGDRAALDVWGKLEYAVYTGNLTAAVRLLKGRGASGEPGEMLAVRLAKALAAANRHAAALEILDLADGGPDFGIKGIERAAPKHTPGPEYLYLKAEMLSETGKRYEAKVFAQKILSDYPLDVFAQKARILLSKI